MRNVQSLVQGRASLVIVVADQVALWPQRDFVKLRVLALGAFMNRVKPIKLMNVRSRDSMRMWLLKSNEQSCFNRPASTLPFNT